MDRLHEAAGAVDVPHPGVLKTELEEDLAAVGAHLHINGVGQVEAALGLHHVGEQRDDIPVLAVQVQLQIVLIGLEVFSAHDSIMHVLSVRPEQAPMARRAVPITAGQQIQRSASTKEPTPGKFHERRCWSLAPRRASASTWAAEAYPLLDAQS